MCVHVAISLRRWGGEEAEEFPHVGIANEEPARLLCCQTFRNNNHINFLNYMGTSVWLQTLLNLHDHLPRQPFRKIVPVVTVLHVFFTFPMSQFRGRMGSDRGRRRYSIIVDVLFMVKSVSSFCTCSGAVDISSGC